MNMNASTLVIDLGCQYYFHWLSKSRKRVAIQNQRHHGKDHVLLRSTLGAQFDFLAVTKRKYTPGQRWHFEIGINQITGYIILYSRWRKTAFNSQKYVAGKGPKGCVWPVPGTIVKTVPGQFFLSARIK
jgi:hypothetical protein